MLQGLAAWVGACWGWDLSQIGIQALGYLPQGPWFVAEAVVAVLCGWICWVLLENTDAGKELPTSGNLLWFFPLIGFYLFKLPFPDLLFDTTNYHLFLQNPTSWNLLRESFFPGAMGTYVWPLGDRVFFLPRELLGYRLGTIVNLAVAWICFVQVLEWLGARRPGAGAFALACLSTEAILVEFGSYYVDLLPIPFLIALMRDSIEPSRPGSLRRAITCSALALCLKMASIPIVLVAIALWVIRADRRLKKIGLPILAIAAFLLLLSPYMVTTAKNTGNPVFPVLNKFFRSPLFPLTSFRDERWGPRSIIEFFLFPILAIFKKTRLYEGAIYGGRLAFYFIPILALLRGIQLRPRQSNQRQKSTNILAVAILAMITLWELSTGYIRYALIIEILMVVLMADIFFTLCEGNSAFEKRMAKMLALVLALQCGGSWVIASKRTVHDFGRIGTGSSFVSDYFNNLTWVGRDQPWHLSAEVRRQLDLIDGLITDEPNGGIWSLLKPEAPLIQLALVWSTQELEKLKQQRISTLAQRRLFAYTLGSAEQPPLQDKIQSLRLRLEDGGLIGPIPFLPTWASRIHIFRVRVL